MMGIHVQKSVNAAEKLIQTPDTSYEELLEQYAKMMKMQTLFAISSIVTAILSFIAIILMLILGGLAFLQEIPSDIQQYEGEYEEELGDFY